MKLPNRIQLTLFLPFLVLIIFNYYLILFCNCANNLSNRHIYRLNNNSSKVHRISRAILLQEINDKNNKEPGPPLTTTTSEMIVKLGLDIIKWLREPYNTFYPILYGIVLTAITLGMEWFVLRRTPLPEPDYYHYSWSSEESIEKKPKKDEDDGSLGLASSVVSLITHGFGLGSAKVSVLDEMNQLRHSFPPYINPPGQQPPPGGPFVGLNSNLVTKPEFIEEVTLKTTTTKFTPTSIITTIGPENVNKVTNQDVKFPVEDNKLSPNSSNDEPNHTTSTLNSLPDNSIEDAIAAFIPIEQQQQQKKQRNKNSNNFVLELLPRKLLYNNNANKR